MPTQTGSALLPLHGGRAPRWLFQRMALLARGVTLAVVESEGPGGVLDRLSQPVWFQAFGCVLGFDWHSSGVTTTVCGAMKEAMKDVGWEVGLFVAGGKGGASRRTPGELERVCDRLGLDPAPLVRSSRMAAKVDTAALQDGYDLYHHAFFFTATGRWSVVQQGMNETTRYARRYHWLGDRVDSFVEEPHAAIASEGRGPVLNLVAGESAGARSVVATLASQEKPEALVRALESVQHTEAHRLPPGAGAQLALPWGPEATADPGPVPLSAARRGGRGEVPYPVLVLPSRHVVHVAQDIDPRRLRRVLLSTYQQVPPDFEALLGWPGVGPATLRALSLVADLIYGIPTSTRDPAMYSFAHGGKDGHPYPVDRRGYDQTIAMLGDAVRRARLGERDRVDALQRLATRYGENSL